MVEYKMIKNLDVDDRPREKLKKYGAKNLTDKELLAILLRTGTKSLNVLDLAGNLIKDIGKIQNLKDVTFSELTKHKGIGVVKAIDILASLELANRIFMTVEREDIVFNSPEVVANYIKQKIEHLKQEVFLVFDLDTKGKIIEEREVFKGSLSSSIVHPREVFKNSIKNSAASIICVHNHPSGEPDPSIEDILVTDKLIKCGETIGIEVLDHIIIAKYGYCSIRKFFNYLEVENIPLTDLSKKKIQALIQKYNLLSNY